MWLWKKKISDHKLNLISQLDPYFRKYKQFYFLRKKLSDHKLSLFSNSDAYFRKYRRF